MDRIILKGLATSNRIPSFAIVLDDIAGSLHTVTGILGHERANILSVNHDWTAGDVPIGRTRVLFTVEVRGKEHLKTVLEALRDKGYDVRVEPYGGD